MANAPYHHGVVTAGTTATLICTVSSNTGIVVQNTGSVAVFLGGSTVTATGATQGVSVAAGASLLVPSNGRDAHGLYAVVASGSAAVAFLYAS